MSGLQTRTVERARTVAALHRAGYTLDVIAHQIGVTPRTAQRLHITARNLPQEPAMATNPTGWEQRGLCRRADPTWFFPPSYHNNTPLVRAAKNVCSACPVRDECLAYALDNPELTVDGIWGGLTPRERNRARTVTKPERTAA